MQRSYNEKKLFQYVESEFASHIFVKVKPKRKYLEKFANGIIGFNE